MIHNKVNAEYDASYRESEDDPKQSKLPGGHLTPEIVCGIIYLALYSAEIPLESSGCVVHIHYVAHILHIITVFVMCRPLKSLACR